MVSPVSVDQKRKRKFQITTKEENENGKKARICIQKYPRDEDLNIDQIYKFDRLKYFSTN